MHRMPEPGRQLSELPKARTPAIQIVLFPPGADMPMSVTDRFMSVADRNAHFTAYRAQYCTAALGG